MGVVLLALVPAGCGGDEDTVDGPPAEPTAAAAPQPADVIVPPSRCPQVQVLQALHQVTRLAPGGVTSDDVLVRGALGPPDGACEYDFNAGTVDVVMTVPVRVVAGPAWTAGQPIDLPYYVWVIDTRRSAPGDVVLRQLFPAPFELDADEPSGLFEEELAVTIPLPDGPQSGENFSVLLGFQMSRAEIDRGG